MKMMYPQDTEKEKEESKEPEKKQGKYCPECGQLMPVKKD
jgi:hypothetical protein